MAVLSVFRYRPLNYLYALFAVAVETLRFPLWLLYYIPKFLRPHNRWSFLQAIRTHIVRQFLYHSAVIETRTPLSLSPGRERDRFVTLPSASPKYYKGPAEDGEVKPAKLGGTWYPEPYDLYKADKYKEDVVLHFHGGAYVIGDGRDHDAGFAAKTMLRHGNVQRVFCPQYRLSSNPGCRFPAQLQDAVTAYYYLTQNLHIPASRVIVSGDSAGGNLVLALLRYLKEYGTVKELRMGFQMPTCAWLWSPWVDLTSAIEPSNMLNHPNYPTDYLNPAFGSWGVRTYCGDSGKGTLLIDPKNPYCSPKFHPFKSDTPLWITAGSAEILCDDDSELASVFKEQGTKTELWIQPGAVHDIILVGALTGFQREAGICAKRAGEFLRENRRA